MPIIRQTEEVVGDRESVGVGDDEDLDAERHQVVRIDLHAVEHRGQRDLVETRIREFAWDLAAEYVADKHASLTQQLS